jgi:RND family efflux transporter MFP subunit
MTAPLSRLLPPLVGTLVLLAAVAWMAGMFTGKVAPDLRARPAPGVDTASAIAVLAITGAQTEAVAASLSAKQATLISARILARITRVHVRAGDTVQQGQLLLELESDDFSAREAQAQQQINAVTARLDEARATLARVAALQQKGLVAAADLDRARANAGALTAELKSSQRALEEARTALSFTAIRAPIDGRVVDRFAEPGDTATPGARLLSLYNPLTLRVEAAVREELALALQSGQTVQVDIPALHQQTSAIIEEVVPAADPGSRSFLVKAALAYNPALLPGMYARVHIPAGVQVRLLIPSDRIARIGQLDMVWVYSADDTGARLEARYIQTGITLDYEGKRYTDVIAGVAAGEQIVPVPTAP